jgi:hypothetical protein
MTVEQEAELRPSMRGSLPPQSDSGLPFQWALGEAVHTLAPKVKEHVLQTPGTVVTYRGRMRVWRDTGWRGRFASWLLHLGAWAKTMFPETGGGC